MGKCSFFNFPFMGSFSYLGEFVNEEAIKRF